MSNDTQTIVVTGATSGIGRAIAVRYAADHANIVVSGRDEARGKEVIEVIDELGGRGVFVPTELSDERSVKNLGEAAQEKFGHVDILVNSGGLLQSGTRVLDQDIDQNDQLWAVNYRGTLLACQVIGRMMKARGKGAIMNLGSLASLAPLSLPAYAPGKAAILSLTQILAAELGPHNVRVNAVAPGYTLSDGLREKIKAGLRDPEAILASTALRSFVQPEHIAEAVHFLCSDKAASITGVILPVDAGWLVQAPYAAYLSGNPVRS